LKKDGQLLDQVNQIGQELRRYTGPAYRYAEARDKAKNIRSSHVETFSSPPQSARIIWIKMSRPLPTLSSQSLEKANSPPRTTQSPL
jgi:hypothetical protein